MSAAATSPADRRSQSSVADYSRAILNILGDLTEEKAQLRATQQAVLNILEDFAEEKGRLELTQRAMLNILEDFDDRTAQLEVANSDLEGFSYSVSHDLRTPLRAIDGFSRILLEDYAGKLDAEGQRMLNVVRDSTVKMSRLIDDILAFSRISSAEMKARPVDMAALVRGALGDDLAPALAGRGLAVDIGSLPGTRGDTAMLRQVWVNLIDNAIKFTAPKPQARIEIGGDATAAETVFYVRDSGVGFGMQYAGKLFGVFQRLHGVEFPGTGIGLAIVKRIIARHGGRVWAEGKPGAGATFYFALPGEGRQGSWIMPMSG